MNKAYLVILYISLLAGLEFPDFDLHLLFFLGHRSILTHGIIIPFFLYTFLNNERYSNIPNRIFGKFFSNKNVSKEILDYVYVGFLIGIAIHLCADLFPKAWIGFALIVFPPWIPMGAPFSIVWMLLNMFLALKIAFKKIKQKDLETKLKNRIFLSVLLIGVIYSIIDTMFISKIILMIISFPIIWYYSNKGFKFIRK
jgi:hypothetical protein